MTPCNTYHLFDCNINASYSMIKIIRCVTVDDSVSFISPIIPMLKLMYEVQVMSSPGDDLAELSTRYNIRVHPVHMCRRISPMRDLVSLWNIIKVFRKERPQIVHSMTPKAGLLCMLAAMITRIPRRIHTFTGLVWPTESGLKRRLLMFTDWLTCVCATHVLPEGQGVLDDLHQNITNKPMRVLGYGNVKGIDMQVFSRRPVLIKESEKIKKKDNFHFLYVGRLVGDKGINELVSAFVRLNSEYPDTTLFMVGDYEKELDPLNIDTIGLIRSCSSIRKIGPKYSDDLLTFYAASDCFVLPSYREGFPNTVLEAGAMGLPCIVTDVNGSREIITNTVNGLIIPPKDKESLYKAMLKMLLEPLKTREMAFNARGMVENRYAQDFVLKCMLDFYKEIE